MLNALYVVRLHERLHLEERFIHVAHLLACANVPLWVVEGPLHLRSVSVWHHPITGEHRHHGVSSIEGSIHNHAHAK